MKKGCIIVLAVVLLGGAVLGAAAVYSTNQRYGYLEAKPVSHEEVLGENVRFRLVAHPGKLAEYAERFMPAGVTLPTWLPWDSNELAQKVMPHEVAILGGTDYERDEISITLFVSERRGGPLLPAMVKESGFLAQSTKVKWDEAGLAFERRGLLQAHGAIALPPGLEARVRQDWDVEARDEALGLEGGHLVEALLDNRTGEALALLGALNDKPGRPWRRYFEDPNLKVLLDVLKDVYSVRLHADLASVDALRIELRIDAAPESAPNFKIIPMMLPMIKESLKQQYKLTLEGTAEWAPAEEAFVGKFRLRGLDALVRERLGAVPK